MRVHKTSLVLWSSFELKDTHLVLDTARKTHFATMSGRGCQEKRTQEKALVSAALAASQPAMPATPTLSKGEVRVLENLYAVGPDAPPIRKQAIDFGLGLDAAGQLEEEGVLTSSDLTEANISNFQTRLKVRQTIARLRLEAVGAADQPLTAGGRRRASCFMFKKSVSRVCFCAKIAHACRWPLPGHFSRPHKRKTILQAVQQKKGLLGVPVVRHLY